MNPSDLPVKEANTPPQDPLSQIGQGSAHQVEVSKEESVAAALCYVPFGAFIKTGVSVEHKNSPFIDYHFRRGTFLLVVFVIGALICGQIGALLSTPFILLSLGAIGYSGYQAYLGNYFEFTFVRMAMNSLVNFLK